MGLMEKLKLLGFFMVWKFLPRPVSPLLSYPFDLGGLVLLGLAIVCSLDALNRLQAPGGEALLIAAGVAAAALALTLFVRRERRTEYPLLQVRLLRRASFLFANIGAIALGLALFGSTYLIPLFVQSALGFSATEAGLLMLPAGIVLGMVFPIAGRLADRRSPRGLIIVGMGLFATSAVLFALSDVALGFAWLALWAVIGRIGLGFMLPALSTAALNPLDIHELGYGSSTINFTRQLGGAYGINLVALTLEYGEHSGGLRRVCRDGGGLPLFRQQEDELRERVAAAHRGDAAANRRARGGAARAGHDRNRPDAAGGTGGGRRAVGQWAAARRLSAPAGGVHAGRHAAGNGAREGLGAR